jgi:anti-sigma factor RsiW
MNEHDEDRMKKLLQQALPPVEAEPEPARDLWPAMLRRLDAKQAAPAPIFWSWFDAALLAGLAVFAIFLPASIPVFLYYL